MRPRSQLYRNQLLSSRLSLAFDLDGVEILFFENVGNLVCPASFDLSEDYRVTLIATTEGIEMDD